MKKEKQCLYEGMYILSATLSEEARKKALEKITKSIEEKKGTIQQVHEMGRRRLAYEIGKKREGYYYVLFFSLHPSEIKELWKEYHLHEDLYRFQTLRVEEVQENITDFIPIKQII